MAGSLNDHKVVSEKEWLEARKALLKKEREFTELRDQLNRQRRELPWEAVDKEYVFDGPDGKHFVRTLRWKKSTYNLSFHV